MDNGLMVLVDVLLIDDRLDVLMNKGLMFFVEDILLVFYKHVFVMLMNHILMDFLDDCRSGMSLSHSNCVSPQYFLSFIERLHNHLFLMLHNDGCFVDCFYDNRSSVIVVDVEVVLSYQFSGGGSGGRVNVGATVHICSLYKANVLDKWCLVEGCGSVCRVSLLSREATERLVVRELS
jgi:hypothetical protein